MCLPVNWRLMGWGSKVLLSCSRQFLFVTVSSTIINSHLASCTTGSGRWSSRTWPWPLRCIIQSSVPWFEEAEQWNQLCSSFSAKFYYTKQPPLEISHKWYSNQALCSLIPSPALLSTVFPVVSWCQLATLTRSSLVNEFFAIFVVDKSTASFSQHYVFLHCEIIPAIKLLCKVWGI